MGSKIEIFGPENSDWDFLYECREFQPFSIRYQEKPGTVRQLTVECEEQNKGTRIDSMPVSRLIFPESVLNVPMWHLKDEIAYLTEGEEYVLTLIRSFQPLERLFIRVKHES